MFYRRSIFLTSSSSSRCLIGSSSGRCLVGSTQLYTPAIAPAPARNYARPGCTRHDLQTRVLGIHEAICCMQIVWFRLT
ncbi:unnamed protein product [Protopolystoma xenopodis]|uniref:Uncharacterized protein n=1 Tax=Protopolystoma xenopodis TaxID=117903 RepID=A0A3S5CQV0_9PLAT|nr:unnamed protein product [Protopolystoma xenopodis]